MASKNAIVEMFENGVHIGHRTQKWNPLMKKFLYGERSGVHIINLEKTAEYLDNALGFVSNFTSQGKKILFVSTKPQATSLVEEVAKSVSMPYVTVRWIPGLLTNFTTIRSRVKYLRDLKEQEASGQFDKYAKNEANSLRKTIVKLEASLGGVQNLQKIPDAVFVLDIVRDKIAVKEAKKIGLPVIAIVDSNSNPGDVDYPIPGNDDALNSLKYFLTKVAGAISAPKK